MKRPILKYGFFILTLFFSTVGLSTSFIPNFSEELHIIPVSQTALNNNCKNNKVTAKNKETHLSAKKTTKKGNNDFIINESEVSEEYFHQLAHKKCSKLIQFYLSFYAYHYQYLIRQCSSSPVDSHTFQQSKGSPKIFLTLQSIVI